MEIIWNTPIIIKIVGVFALILFLIRRKQQLGTAFMAGAVLLGLWCGMGIGELAASIATTMLEIKTLLLSAVVVLILILSRSLDSLGQMKRLLSSFQGLVNNVRFNLVVFPALIGLLPMPGGAIFSAPMVDELGNEHDLDPEAKSLLNYWFRHIWEFAWPLYPGVLLASSMSSVSLWTFISRSFPLSLLSTIIGYVFLLKPLAINTSSTENRRDPEQLQTFLKEMIPIILVIIGAISGSICIAWLQKYFPTIGTIPNEVPLIISLLLSILYVWKVNNASIETIRSILLNRSLLKMIYMIVGIFVFKEVLVDSHAVVDLSRFLVDLNIPILLLVVLIPFIAGSISGIAVAFIGTSYPVLLSLFQTMQVESHLALPYLVLAFCTGFAGVLLSPLHVCLIFTREYFHADFRLIYHRMWKPVVALILGGLVYIAVFVALGG